MFCTRCGQQNPADAHFCARCGAPLVRPGAPVAERGDQTSTLSLQSVIEEAEEAADTDVGAVDALPPGSALLVVRRGPNAGSRFLLDKDVVTAGRHPESDIFLDDVTVSRNHAVLIEENGIYVVEDQGSLNGTFVNRRRIDRAPLAEGDELQVGKYRMTFIA